MYVPKISPTLHLSSFQAQDMRHPVVSFKMAQTSILTSPRRSIACCRSCTTSLPSTSEQLKFKQNEENFTYSFTFSIHQKKICIYLKPFVHLTKLAFAKPCCSQGNENVKPKGKISSCNSRLWTKSARQLAM